MPRDCAPRRRVVFGGLEPRPQCFVAFLQRWYFVFVVELVEKDEIVCGSLEENGLSEECGGRGCALPIESSRGCAGLK